MATTKIVLILISLTLHESPITKYLELLYPAEVISLILSQQPLNTGDLFLAALVALNGTIYFARRKNQALSIF